jgi:alpha-tubulin suppressor-like RCC1 family protein
MSAKPKPGMAFKQVAVGADHTCGVTPSGAAYCWGGNDYGQLGDGSVTSSTVPAPVAGGLSFASVSVGWSFTCGVTPGGAAYCWGANDVGSVGNGTADTLLHASPVPVTGGLTFAAVSAGVAFACGVTTTGAAYCWGANYFGQLGNGASDTIPHATPVAVAGGLTFAAVSAGQFHACGLTSGGAAYCWGLNQMGAVGNGAVLDAPVSVTNPSPVIGGGTFTSVAAGWFGTCALSPGGAAWCWGYGGNGELGVESPDVSGAPVPVSGGVAFSSVSQGEALTCGVATDHVAWCWGASALVGKIAPNKTCGNSPGGEVCASKEPEPVDGDFAFASVSVGGGYACGLTTDGAAWCWGENGSGQLGDGTTSYRPTPVPVAGPMVRLP